MSSRIGIMGGVYDPVHSGHLQVAVNAKKEAGLERVFLVLTEFPPHKKRTDFASREEREKMLRLAIEDLDGLYFSDVESSTGNVTYTIDTVKYFTGLYPDAELFLIIGSDSLEQFTSWRDWEKILELARLVVAKRSQTFPDLNDRLEPYRNRIIFLENHPFLEFSSTEIREAIRQGRKPEGLPEKVARYIETRGLYRN